MDLNRKRFFSLRKHIRSINHRRGGYKFLYSSRKKWRFSVASEYFFLNAPRPQDYHGKLVHSQRYNCFLFVFFYRNYAHIDKIYGYDFSRTRVEYGNALGLGIEVFVGDVQLWRGTKWWNSVFGSHMHSLKKKYSKTLLYRSQILRFPAYNALEARSLDFLGLLRIFSPA